MATATRVLLSLTFCLTVGFLVGQATLHAGMEAGGCGPRSLYEVAEQLGVPASAATVSRLFPRGGARANFLDMQRAARTLGLRAEGRRMTLSGLRRAHPLGILHVGSDHFVALLGDDAGGFTVSDPAFPGDPRRAHWSDVDLAARWDGCILVVRRQ